jgi:hypothetical protein
MISSNLREKILQYIELDISKTQLEEWFVPRLPVFLRYPESADADVVSAVELGLAEMTAGIRTEDNFRKFLRRVIQEQTAVATFFPPAPNSNVESTSSNQTYDDSPASIVFESGALTMTPV